ncbi:9405_t:CDS:2 [Ambispora gerdemannii]|uniref:9405_t:CDS:1 n=1 Tax=Ambispora gerdemannii TaxID=144530 RepID=A0A9N9AVT6_9GLOM|nr:9405_t:CDS:2 [Ambispora gerdemannii]
MQKRVSPKEKTANSPKPRTPRKRQPKAQVPANDAFPSNSQSNVAGSKKRGRSKVAASTSLQARPNQPSDLSQNEVIIDEIDQNNPEILSDDNEIEDAAIFLGKPSNRRIGTIHPDSFLPPGRLQSLDSLQTKPIGRLSSIRTVPDYDFHIVKEDDDVDTISNAPSNAVTMRGNQRTTFTPNSPVRRKKLTLPYVDESSYFSLDDTKSGIPDFPEIGPRPRRDFNMVASGPFAFGPAESDMGGHDDFDDFGEIGSMKIISDNKLKSEVENAQHLANGFDNDDLWAPIVVFGEKEEEYQEILEDIQLKILPELDLSSDPQPVFMETGVYKTPFSEIDDDLYLMQFPANMPEFLPPQKPKVARFENQPEQRSQQRNVTAQNSKALQNNKAQNKSKTTDEENQEKTDEIKIEPMPEGRIGTFLVYKNGDIKLKIGEIIYDIFPASDVTFPQTAVVIDTDEETKGIYEMGNITKQWLVAPNIENLFNSSDDDEISESSHPDIKGKQKAVD